MDPEDSTATSGTDAPTDLGPVETTIASESQALNPAWNEMIAAVPEAFAPLITPHLRKWDANYAKLQGDFESYREFKEQQISPDTIKNALNVMQVLDQNPRAVYDRMVEHFGEEWGLNGPTVNEDPMPLIGSPDGEIESDPRIAELTRNQEILTQFLYSQEQAKINAQEDQLLDNQLNTLASKYGQFDERYVISLAKEGVDLEEAVRAYKELEARIAGPKVIPGIMPTNGGIPSSSIDVTALDKKNARGLALSYIQSLKGN